MPPRKPSAMAAATAPSSIDQIEWNVVEGENTEFTAQYARLQWVHGNKQASGFMQTGGLFINKDQYPNFNGEGFEETVLITREGKSIAGYGASATKLAVIRIKNQWVEDEQYHRNVPLAHVLCMVKGVNDLVCISLRGAAKALEFQKVFNQHMAQNVALANRTRPDGTKPLEPFALWLPLQAAEQSMVGSKDGANRSAVTLPEMQMPETLDRNYVVSLWVGADTYKACVAYYRETATWQTQPIWAKRDGEASPDDTPAFTGGDDIELSDASDNNGMRLTGNVQGTGGAMDFPEHTVENLISEDQVNKLRTLHQPPLLDIAATCKEWYSGRGVRDLTEKEAAQFIEHMEEWLSNQKDETTTAKEDDPFGEPTVNAPGGMPPPSPPKQPASKEQGRFAKSEQIKAIRHYMTKHGYGEAATAQEYSHGRTDDLEKLSQAEAAVAIEVLSAQP